MIEDGSIHIDTEGEVSARPTDSSFSPWADHAFGKPSRITARVSSDAANSSTSSARSA
jgi:hypothetical protein